MDKQQIISFIQGQINAGKITREELVAIARDNPDAFSSTPIAPFSASVVERNQESPSKNLINVFYVIGAIIALIGVVILVAQNWNDIGVAGRVISTLGISLVTYVAGILLMGAQHRVISQVMFILSAALAPLGVVVLLNEANMDLTLEMQMAISAALAVLYGAALLISKRNILLLITLGFASWTYYAFILNAFVDSFRDADMLKWATMLLGLSYIAIAYGHKLAFAPSSVSDEGEKNAIRNLIYGIGSAGILGGAMFIGGVFDLIQIGLIFAVFYASVYVRSRSMLLVAGAFLMAHIIKLTSQYFVGSVGWPVALIFVGFLVIGVGYMTFYLNKKFISSAHA